MAYDRQHLAYEAPESDFITRLWYGEIGLAKTYWIFYNLGFFLIGVAISIAKHVSSFALYFVIIWAALYGLFITVSLWRSSSNYKNSHLKLAWLGTLVQATIIIVYLFLALGFYAANGTPAPASEKVDVERYREGINAFKSQDYAAAGRFYWPLANSGDAIAQFMVGTLFVGGQPFGQDYDAAVSWFRKAADQGHIASEIQLARAYTKGLGVAQDYPSAIFWARKAADQGSADGKATLGAIYSLAHDDTEGEKWLEKAANQGHVFAQGSVAFDYEYGKGVPQNYIKAYMWYNIAASKGDNFAQEGRDGLVGRMSPDQLAEAQRESQNWTPQ